MSKVWTNQELDQARTVADPPADQVVAELFRTREVDAVNELLRTLVINDGLPSALLPPIVLDYLAQTAVTPSIAAEQLSLGEEVFGAWGPEILMVLGFYALPADYAAKKGVQVLYRTGRLTHNPLRRVFETTQMVVDVMSPGGLSLDGRGMRSAQKVRLMHAAVRHLLTHDRQRPWDPSFGAPINQEDLAGTLMSFSFVVLDGLERLGVTLQPEEQQAYFQVWMAIGRVMGIRQDLIPENLADCKALTQLIHQRQIAASPEGVALASALVEGYQGLMPDFLRGTPASMIHYFLDHDPFSGQNVAAMLGVPPANWTSVVAKVVVDIDHFFDRFQIESSLADKAFSVVSRHLVEGLLLVERGGRRAPFTIPDHLLRRWSIPTPARAEG